jgi:hypothetical protein
MPPIQSQGGTCKSRSNPRNMPGSLPFLLQRDVRPAFGNRVWLKRSVGRNPPSPNMRAANDGSTSSSLLRLRERLARPRQNVSEFCRWRTVRVAALRADEILASDFRGETPLHKRWLG